MKSFRENSKENSNFCISSNYTNKPERNRGRVNEEVKETVLRMMRNNSTSREISSATGLNIRTVHRWVSKLYRSQLYSIGWKRCLLFTTLQSTIKPY